MQRSRTQKALFMGINDEIRLALRHGGMSWDEAIQTLQDKIAQLEQLRDRGVDPKSRGAL